MIDATSLRAVILDMDGVIVDSEAQWRIAERQFLSRIAPRWTEEDDLRVVGLGALDLYRFLVERHGFQTPQDQFLEHCNAMAHDIYTRRASLAPGLLEFFQCAAEMKLQTALASSANRDWIEMVLERFQLRRHFHAVVSVDDAGGRGKPLPDIYLQALKLLDLNPSQAIAVEDSSHGVLSAKRAGLFCVGFRNGTNHNQDLSLANTEVVGFPHLREKLETGRKAEKHPSSAHKGPKRV